MPKNNKNNKTYSKEQKEAILSKLFAPNSMSVPELSDQSDPYSEALFRTCKYRSGYPTEGFESIDAAREWVNGFVEWYNNEHYHSGLNFVTPNTRHNGTAKKIMKKREKSHLR